MTGRGEVEDAWRSFLNRPALYAAAGRLASCFDGAIADEACTHMLGAGRLEVRLSRLIGEYYGLDLPDEDPDEADRLIALCDAKRLADIALKAGAIYWSASFAGVIRRDTMAALHAQLSEALCEFALLNRDLGGPDQAIEPMVGLAERVAADGRRCLAAWCAALPAGVGTRVRLKLSPSPELDDLAPGPFAQLGAAIIRRAASAA